MMRNIRFRFVLLFLGIVSAGHFAAIGAGLYKGNVWVDMPLHIIGGMLFGVLALWILGHLPKRFIGEPSSLFVAFSIVAFSLTGSFLWELFEMGFSTYFPTVALSLKMYSFTLSDALSDMLMGIVGGVVVAWYVLKK